MVASTRESDILVNALALPRTYNATQESAGKPRVQTGTLETAAADDATSMYALCKLPASASVKSIILYHDALTGLSDANVGLYTGPNEDDLTDADENCYADAIDLTSASVTGTEVAYEVRDVANINNRVYEDAGDSLGDFAEYWLCLTLESDVSTAATLSFKVEYVID